MRSVVVIAVFFVTLPAHAQRRIDVFVDVEGVLFVRVQDGRARNEVADPTGLVVDGGLEFNLGRRFNLLADARYVPIETKSRATFPGTTSSLDLSVRPAIVAFGLGYRF
jgi:outer membrane protein W